MEKKRILQLPTTPGIYKFLDTTKTILYIGKAKNIRKRVTQHFQDSKNAPLKNKKMLQLVTDIDCIQTDNEIEALVLESTLIKEHHPKYNILLRDDKNFLYVKISLQETYPSLSLVRRITDKKSTYFGPYTDATALRYTLSLIEKIFPYECLTFFKKGVTTQPCFNYHIKRCPGLCIGAISSEEYGLIMKGVARFLRGDIGTIVEDLQEKMKRQSNEKQYEQAAKTRDNLFALEAIMKKQKVIDPNNYLDQDVFGIVKIGKNLYTNVFQIRSGKLLAQENFVFRCEDILLDGTGDMMGHIVKSYYDLTTDIPDRILVEELPANLQVLSLWLETMKRKKVVIIAPEKGTKHHLIQLSQKNAEMYADKEEYNNVSHTGIHSEIGIKELQKLLNLKMTPIRIECYDISHLAGKFTVASMVVFVDGKPDKKEYRQFKMNTIGNKIDDYQSMRETLERRLKYIINPALQEIVKNKKESFLKKPDLMVLDGGKGQLSVGVQVLSRFDLLKSIPLISLAKENEDIFSPQSVYPLEIKKDSQAQYLLERLRDEAHRFANSFNRNLREKKERTSLLNDIKGFGSATKKKLLKSFGSLAEVKKADIATVEKVIGKKLAQKLKEKL